MKSFNLIIFYIFVIFVISSEASVIKTEKDIDAELSFNNGNNYKVWLREVKGYNENDASEGYAGIFGEPVTSIRISGEQDYTVRLLDNELWFAKVNGSSLNIYDVNGYAGRVNGSPIDGIVIAANVEYRVHIEGGGWLDPVKGDPSDLDGLHFVNEKGKENNLVNFNPKHFAGKAGKAIDAVMIKGRTYATSFTSDHKCTDRKGDCMGDVCCIQNTDVNNTNNNVENGTNNNTNNNVENGTNNNTNNNVENGTNNNTNNNVENGTSNGNAKNNKSNGDSKFSPVLIIIITVLSFLVVVLIIAVIWYLRKDPIKD